MLEFNQLESFCPLKSLSGCSLTWVPHWRKPLLPEYKWDIKFKLKTEKKKRFVTHMCDSHSQSNVIKFSHLQSLIQTQLLMVSPLKAEKGSYSTVWTLKTKQKNQCCWTSCCFQFIGEESKQDWKKLRGFEYNCAYGEWHPKLQFLTATGSKHKRCDTEKLPSVMLSRSFRSGGNLREEQIKHCKSLLYAAAHPLRPGAISGAFAM